MRDLPKLVVTREEAKTFSVSVGGLGASRVVLRLPERPTTTTRMLHATGSVTFPIPEGARVEVGWRGIDLNDPYTRIDPDWHPVDTAALASVEKRGEAFMGREFDQYVVTLADVEACHE